jgi:hypothetical protein
MSETLSPPPSSTHFPNLLQILASFSLISLYGFGGVLAWSRRMMVEERRWMTSEEFNDAYALCQFLPGPNIVNLSVVFGARVRGAAGAAMALTGLLGPPVAIISMLGLLYAHYGEVRAISQALSGPPCHRGVTALPVGSLLCYASRASMCVEQGGGVWRISQVSVGADEPGLFALRKISTAVWL